MAKRDPAFLFYSDDFYIGTENLSFEHLGMYIKLLMKQHLNGWFTEANFFAFFGSTKVAPNLHQICTQFAPVIEKFTKKNTGKQIYYYNKRLDFEVKKRMEYAESRRLNAAGKRGKNSKQVNGKFVTNDEIKKKHMHIHMGNGNGNIKRGMQGGKNMLYFSLDEIKNILARKNDFNHSYVYGFHVHHQGFFENEGDLISKFNLSVKLNPPKIEFHGRIGSGTLSIVPYWN
jgi:uncharacterized protein YdaU (DUF1376 family)